MNICVALDAAGREENLSIARQIKEFDVWLKVGFRSYIRDSKALLDDIRSINPNFKIFLDLKLYDIPNTMADAAEEIAALGVDMFNVHASSGIKAMKAVMERLGSLEKRPLVLAVTALTSFDEDGFYAVYNESIEQKAAKFAKESKEAGLDGVVCSAHESMGIKGVCGDSFFTLCPGIRGALDDKGDQSRTMSAAEAKAAKVDFAVIGRPIYKALDPKGALENILLSIK